MNTFSILNKADSSLVLDDPFPHIVIENALPANYAKSLTNSFPTNLFSYKDNNTRLDYSALETMNDTNVKSYWKEFIDYHSSESFFFEVLEIFKNNISEADYKKFIKMKTLKRGFEIQKNNTVYLDAQISINSPVNKPSSVRKIHVDNSNKLFSGLFYLRLQEDDSVGGNLELYKWKDSYTFNEKIKIYEEGLNPKFCDLVKEVEYRNNVGIIFLNSIDSLHGVSERQETKHPRCFVNLVCETKKDIFIKHGFLKRKLLNLKSSILKARKFMID